MKTNKINTRKEILQKMKEELLFLQQYAAQLRLHSALYQEENVLLQVEDDLCDYLHYTKSILDVRQRTHKIQEPVLQAMEQQSRKHAQTTSRSHHAYELLLAILQLPEKEKALLLDIYVRNQNRKIVQHHQGDIVESTLYRRLNRAYLHLYELLNNIDSKDDM